MDEDYRGHNTAHDKGVKEAVGVYSLHLLPTPQCGEVPLAPGSIISHNLQIEQSRSSRVKLWIHKFDHHPNYPRRLFKMFSWAPHRCILTLQVWEEPEKSFLKHQDDSEAQSDWRNTVIQLSTAFSGSVSFDCHDLGS